MNVSGSIPLHVARAYGVQGPRAAAPAERLVAARVQPPAKPDLETPPPASAGALPLYTRAADKVEASVAVQLGRTLDLKG